MSVNVSRYIENEFVLLDRLLEKHRSLIDIAKREIPEEFYITTLGAMLHSFYNGIENIFKRIVVDIDGMFSKSNSWHKLLLDRMSSLGNDRPAIISRELRKELHMYLDFRHVFRGLYSYDLNWLKMKELVLNCEGTLSHLKVEIYSYLNAASLQDEGKC